MAIGSNTVVVGIHGTVVAVDRDTGRTLWSTGLKGTEFVNVALERGDVFAASRGRLYRLDATTGDILWCNALPGLGYGIVSIAGASQSAAAEDKRRRDAAAAAAAVTAGS